MSATAVANVGMRFKHTSVILVEEFLTTRRFDCDISLIPIEDRESDRNPLLSE
jgi:hypothetical protein